MKKILLLVVFGFLFFSGNSLFAQDAKKSGGFGSIGVLGGGLTIKGGYKTNNARFHYTHHSISSFTNGGNFKTVTASILGVDYISNGGFMIGVGLGTATSPEAIETDLTNSSSVPSSFRKKYFSSTSATAFNIGWLKNKKGFQYGVYVFSIAFPKPLLAGFVGSSGYSLSELSAVRGLKAEFGFVF